MLLVVSIAGPVAGAASTVVVTYIDVRAKAAEANNRTEASYETLAPAVTELQELVRDGLERAEETDSELRDLKDSRNEIEKRVLRLETYIEVLSLRRNLPRAPDPVASSSISRHPAMDRQPKKTVKPARPIPQDVSQAKAYQRQRVQMKCSADDPLCGALE